jgi:phytoene dehydrogenase-like protein
VSEYPGRGEPISGAAVMSRYKAVVIGGGLGGLATALRLSVRGWNVSVYEKEAAMGGKMNSLSLGGFKFDTGPSLITMPWVFSELFESAGERMDEHLHLQPVEPLGHYVFDDGVSFPVSSSLPQWLETLQNLELHGEQKFLEFMRQGARLSEKPSARSEICLSGEPGDVIIER